MNEVTTSYNYSDGETKYCKHYISSSSVPIKCSKKRVTTDVNKSERSPVSKAQPTQSTHLSSFLLLKQRRRWSRSEQQEMLLLSFNYCYYYYYK